MVTGALLDRSTNPMHAHESATQIVLALTKGVEIVLGDKAVPVAPFTHYAIEPRDWHFVRLASGARAYTFHVGENNGKG